jgi:hypothetical protein
VREVCANTIKVQNMWLGIINKHLTDIYLITGHLGKAQKYGKMPGRLRSRRSRIL